MLHLIFRYCSVEISMNLDNIIVMGYMGESFYNLLSESNIDAVSLT